MSLGKRIRALREEKGVRQEDIGKLFSVSKSAVSQWENDIRTPDMDIIVKLADYFSCNTDYLLGRTDDPTPPEKLAKLGLDNIIRVMKDNRGMVATEAVPLLLIQIVALYALSKGIPVSVLMTQLSEVNLSEEDPSIAQLAGEIDSILSDNQEELGSAGKLAKEIGNLPSRDREAMETMLAILKRRDEDAATKDFGPEVLAAHRTDNPMDDLPEASLRNIAKLKRKYLQKMNKKQK